MEGIFWPLAILIAVVAMFGFKIFKDRKNSFNNKDVETMYEDAIKTKEDKENEIKKMDASDVVDNLDNAEDVRGVLDRGRNSFLDRVRQVILKFGSKGTGSNDSTDSK